MALDLMTLIFTQILKISPSLMAQYPSIQDKLIYLILIPHVILIMFIAIFSDIFSVSLRRGTVHGTIKYLVAIVTYIFIIYSGWYGGFFVAIANAWFIILLIFGVIGFFLIRIVPPQMMVGLGGVAAKLGENVGKNLSKEKAREKLEEELKALRKEEIRLMQEYDKARSTPGLYLQANALYKELTEVKKAIKQLEKEKAKL